jgi:pantetheine-phosphate adenylyltransferase
VTTALVPGSFDPPTNGHLDVIAHCATLFDRVVVSVVENPSKSPLFSAAERVEMLQESTAKWVNVEIDSFSGLLVDHARLRHADVMVKGLRAITDFEYELSMSQMNRTLSGIVTLFVPTAPEHGYISSSLVKEVARYGSGIADFVPPNVARALEERFSS